ncbi:MAG: hypothetical protein NVS3B6_09280 [Pseudarthrobacter sp.]
MTPAKEPGEDTAAESAMPLFSVVKGEPSAEELAALTAVVLSLGVTDAPGTGKPNLRHWVRRQQLRLAPRPGPGEWRRSRG